jgi:subtilisin-like proprotein convertase family protein
MKRISVLILVAALAVPFAIAACGGGGGGGGGGGSVNSEYVSTDTPISIPDNDVVTGAVSQINVSGIAGTIAKVTVDVNIKHTWDDDLTIWLESPEGTLVNLAFWAGGDGNNFNNTRFDDDASTAIADGSAPFDGSYIPEEALSNIDGEDPNGNWFLIVLDDTAEDTGTLNSWGLNID